MAETGPDPITTLDALFQLLTCVRDVSPVLARNQILAALQADKLQVDFQVRDGPGDHVHWQAWERVFTLSIEDGHSVIGPRCALDYPMEDYSFTIANSPVVGELWPEPPRVHSLQVTDFILGGPDFAQPTLETEDKPVPQQWFNAALKRYPRAANEGHAAYARRLHEHMQAAYAANVVTELWEVSTLERRLKDDAVHKRS
jgi:hypothetical protein